MNSITSYKLLVCSFFLLVFATGCSKEYDTETFENTSLVTVKLQGTQSVFSKVNIEVLEVQFRVLEDENDPYAWVTLNTINTGIHDLSSITDNQVVTLVDFDEVPSEFIYSIKLVLGDQNSAKKNGVEYTLLLDAETENASANIVEKQLISNSLYEFVMELDLDESIEISTEGNAKLDPKMNTLLRRFELF
ncbi:DUF4382 domain-containing protein [Psychroserpens sp. SPM9]|uniref:DUF4382 domain-containing protein n=1 Tax=Psychroserpens sp. SPM9 TaxID=2975598 RepID=UPI0021A8C028|nr:DUF4382 domain-containing protein [Psychroserpens sp. SPM9]MDG5490892.1 DUF4382 domain-containing protein [Psychroserpens sp. SPM9]